MGRNPLVMIIDEDPIFRQELQGMLTPARLAVVAECGYGVEAASLAEELKPDLFLAAVEEPIARAVQTIEAVRSIRPGAPVIAYSSSTDLATVRQVMHAGARDLLAHPFKVGELLTAIEMAMRNAEREPGAKEAPPPAGTILTVFGAKGGIGKTTITTNVAAAIAKNTDNSVLVMDLDTRFGDVAIMLDIEPTTTVAEMASQVQMLDRATFKAALIEHSSGVYVLPSPKHPNHWRQVEAEDLHGADQVGQRSPGEGPPVPRHQAVQHHLQVGAQGVGTVVGLGGPRGGTGRRLAGEGRIGRRQPRIDVRQRPAIGLVGPLGRRVWRGVGQGLERRRHPGQARRDR